MFEVGPTVSDPPGRAREEHRGPAERAAAQRASEGPQRRSGDRQLAGAVKSGAAPGAPGTFLLPDGYQFEGEDGLPVAAMSSNVGGMAAHWTGACPRPGGSERIAFLARPRRAARRGANGCSA